MRRFLLFGMLVGAVGCGEAWSPEDRIAEAQTAVVQDLVERVGPQDGGESACLFEAMNWGGSEDALWMPEDVVPPPRRLVERLDAAGIFTRNGFACGPEAFKVFVGQPEETADGGFEVPVMWRVASGGGIERCVLDAGGSSRSRVNCTGEFDF